MKQEHLNAVILIVEDDEDDFFITSTYLKAIPNNKFTIKHAPNYSAGVKMLHEERFNLCFVDYRLGAKNGVDFIEEVVSAGIYTPIVLLTGFGSYETDIKAMESGATDYLVKSDLNTEKAERCIRYALERAEMICSIKRSESKYRNIFEKSKDIIFITDSELRITDISHATLSLLGVLPEELEGAMLTDLLQQSEAAIVSEAVGRGLSMSDLPVTIVGKSGDTTPCTITLSVETGQNNDKYVQGIIHDISSLKKAESTLIQNEKLATTARLIRTLAHEIRNPLNNIIMSAEQLDDEPEPDEATLFTGIIKRNGARINEIINNLLKASSTDSGVNKPTDLRIVVQSALGSAKDRITLKKIKTSTYLPATPATVIGNQRSLELALRNVIINAIEAMNEKTGTLTINLTTDETATRLSVADNGQGIKPEDINKIFEPFYSGKPDGTGLGLAFAQSILKAHEAEIEVSSAPGKGTDFSIIFKNA